MYDYESKEFFLVASGVGRAFTPANKNRKLGIQTLNVLFKNCMVSIDEDDVELSKLVVELSTLKENQTKNNAKDNLVDPARYLAMAVPWNWEAIKSIAPHREDGGIDMGPDINDGNRIRSRRHEEVPVSYDVDQELDSWNELYGD